MSISALGFPSMFLETPCFFCRSIFGVSLGFLGPARGRHHRQRAAPVCAVGPGHRQDPRGRGHGALPVPGIRNPGKELTGEELVNPLVADLVRLGSGICS